MCQRPLVSAGPTRLQGGVIYLGPQRQSICNWCSALIEILCWQRKQQLWPLLSKSLQSDGESKHPPTQKSKWRVPGSYWAWNTAFCKRLLHKSWSFNMWNWSLWFGMKWWCFPWISGSLSRQANLCKRETYIFQALLWSRYHCEEFKDITALVHFSQLPYKVFVFWRDRMLLSLFSIYDMVERRSPRPHQLSNCTCQSSGIA